MDRKKGYFWLMGTCLALILLAWNVVRFWSVTAAVVMSVIAAVIPPVAAIVGNRGRTGG
jgi:multisubunit Na+/H+ antiporter MnhG subunit